MRHRPYFDKFNAGIALRFYKSTLIAIIIFTSASPIFEGMAKTVAATVALALLFFPSWRGWHCSRISIISLFIITILLVPHAALLDESNGYSFGWKSFGFWGALLIAFFIASLISKNELLRVNERVVLYAALIGIPVYAVVVVYPELINIMPTYTYGPYTHHTAGFVNFLYADGLVLRFTSFASEPGLASMFFLWALWYRAEENQGNMDWQSWLFVLGIILMRSTAGLFLMLVVLVMYVRPRILLLAVFVASPALVFYLYGEIEYHLANKLIGSDSFDIRYSRYLDFFRQDGLNIFFGFGNGFYDDVLVGQDLAGWDSFLQVAQRYGCLSVLILFLLLVFNNMRYRGIAIIIAVTFASQSIWLMPAVAVFYFRDKHGN